jgi:hypothetical protein
VHFHQCLALIFVHGCCQSHTQVVLERACQAAAERADNDFRQLLQQAREAGSITAVSTWVAAKPLVSLPVQHLELLHASGCNVVDVCLRYVHMTSCSVMMCCSGVLVLRHSLLALLAVLLWPCVCACVRACLRACVGACVRVCVCVCRIACSRAHCASLLALP